MSASETSDTTPPAPPARLRPLRPGDRLALVAPSSPFDTDQFHRACGILEDRGYQLTLGKHVLQRNGYLAGSDLERAEDLYQALTDPLTAAVICVRGGYGSGRVLDCLPFSLLSRRPKIFMGYSDVTFLHGALRSRSNWMTFHGPNLMELATEGGDLSGETLGALEGKNAFSWILDEKQILRHGVGTGPIVGGNLTCFAHLIGTPYLPNPSGSLLFLEDRGEALYRIDRTFTQLKEAGVLGCINGLILGSFQDCGALEELWKMVLGHARSYLFPIVCALPFGHGSKNETLPLGLPFLLDTARRVLKALESPFLQELDEEIVERRGKGLEGKLHALSAPDCHAPRGAEPLIDDLFEEALGNRTFSAASVLLADPDDVIFHRTWGWQRYGGVGIDGESHFDLASLTKPLVVAPLLMEAISKGSVELEDSLGKFFPASSLSPGHRKITVRHLLNHCSGLPAYEPFYRRLILMPSATRKEALPDLILSTPLVAEPGKASSYSDLGFILLGLMLEMVHGNPLNALFGRFLAEHFNSAADDGGSFNLRLTTATQNSRSTADDRTWKKGLTYIPLEETEDPTSPPRRVEGSDISCVATEFCPWRNRLLEGEAHDENAYCLNGVAGHAGLFGTASGVATLLSSLWRVYLGAGKIGTLTREAVKLFWRKQEMVPESTWTLGYDTPSPEGSSAGDFFSSGSVGHLGFTGTSFWIDLDRERMLILLTNRVHPSRSNEKIRLFRPAMHNLMRELFGG